MPKRLFCIFLSVLLFVTTIIFPSPAYAKDLETGKDRRTDGISTSFESANQYTNLFTGSASYSIPIKLPEGPGNFTPSLGLQYNSDRGNGWLGLGWELSGLSRIERSTKYGIPTYVDPPCSETFSQGSNYDRFNLNHNGRNYELLWDAKSKSYVSNPYEHFKIKHSCKWGVSSWEITDKSGVKYTFEGVPAGGREGSRFYRIQKAKDPNDNIISYEYVDGKNGAYYPKQISYGPTIATTKQVQPKGVKKAQFGKSKVLIEFELEARNTGGGTIEEVNDYKGGSDLGDF